MRFRIVPIDEAVAEEARATRRSPGYGHPVVQEVAKAYGPCRLCLSPFETGVDERLLLTYDAFREIETLPLPGPIFIHHAHCAPYSEAHHYPDALRFIPTTLNAYGRGRALRDVRYIEPGGDAESEIVELLGRSDVDYIHVRNTEAGCYMFRIERH
ncbi:MAG TPA: DUF1203 domain-containing protein [Longimicrobiales bacterium]